MPPAALPILAAIAAAALALAAALLLRRGGRDAAARLDLERRLAAAEQQCRDIPEMQGALQQREVTIRLLSEQKAALAAELAAARAAAEEKLALLTAAREDMKKEFRVLAEEVMAGHGKTFGEQNRAQIGTLLDPLRLKLTEFQQGLQTAQLESAKERAALAQQILQLSDRSARFTSETENLTRALKGNTQVQGAWGEMLLATILERSGLREGEEYALQESHTTGDGARLRPDVIVNLPGGQRIVVDAKVSLVAFEAYVNAQTDPERETHLAAHADSLRRHIRTLGDKEYHVHTGGALDYVLLFVPIEGALAAALQAGPELTAYATRCNVAIATPTTLMIALRTVANVWSIERRHRNADEIARRAGLIYDKFVGFADDMKELGQRLDQARSSYDGAFGKLSQGKGNLARQMEQLKALGARTSKALPAGWVENEAEAAE